MGMDRAGDTMAGMEGSQARDWRAVLVLAILGAVFFAKRLGKRWRCSSVRLGNIFPNLSSEWLEQEAAIAQADVAWP
jgi:hypothetical protein